jgi:hypothetical protein
MATGFYLIDHPNRLAKQYGEVRRGGEKPSGTCVVHTAENVADQIGEDLGAEAVARYCSTRSDYGAYHRLVDADSIVPMVPFGYETWHCTKTNPWSCSISAAVEAGDWKRYGDDYETRVLRNLARAGAEFVRAMKKYWGIIVPIKHITGAEARAQKPGFTGHGETDPGRRSDPGADFDWARFLRMVRAELAADDAIEAASLRPFHTEWAICPTQVRETPGGTVVRTLRLGDSASVIDGSGTKQDGWTHWWGETTTGNWVCLTDMSEARPYHTREVTTETHPYDQPGTGMQDRVLAVGARFTVWDGSAVEVDDVWWIQSTAGNWFRSTDTRKIISNPEG